MMEPILGEFEDLVRARQAFLSSDSLCFDAKRRMGGWTL